MHMKDGLWESPLDPRQLLRQSKWNDTRSSKEKRSSSGHDSAVNCSIITLPAWRSKGPSCCLDTVVKSVPEKDLGQSFSTQVQTPLTSFN